MNNNNAFYKGHPCGSIAYYYFEIVINNVKNKFIEKCNKKISIHDRHTKGTILDDRWKSNGAASANGCSP